MAYVKRDCVVIFSSPDEYRGSMDCIRFSPEAYTIGVCVSPVDVNPSINEVTRLKDRKNVGILKTWYGNGGKSSKVACQVFNAADGVEVLCGD